jgi:hypothetical protein
MVVNFRRARGRERGSQMWRLLTGISGASKIYLGTYRGLNSVRIAGLMSLTSPFVNLFPGFG